MGVEKGVGLLSEENSGSLILAKVGIFTAWKLVNKHYTSRLHPRPMLQELVLKHLPGAHHWSGGFRGQIWGGVFEVSFDFCGSCQTVESELWGKG